MIKKHKIQKDVPTFDRYVGPYWMKTMNATACPIAEIKHAQTAASESIALYGRGRRRECSSRPMASFFSSVVVTNLHAGQSKLVAFFE